MYLVYVLTDTLGEETLNVSPFRSLSLSLPDSDGNARVGEPPSGLCTYMSTSI